MRTLLLALALCACETTADRLARNLGALEQRQLVEMAREMGSTPACVRHCQELTCRSAEYGMHYWPCVESCAQAGCPGLDGGAP